MKPYVGNYGWTPQQMAKINAGRQLRGQQPLLDTRMGEQDYMDQYSSYSPRKNAGMATDMNQQPEESLQKRMAGSQSDFKRRREMEQAAFRERFDKRKMLPREMTEMRGAISTPIIGGSYSRMV